MHNKDFSRFDIRRQNFNSWEENIVDIDAIYAEFEALDNVKLPSSRIRSYRDAFQTLWERAQSKDKLDLRLAHRVVNTMVEFHQLKTILKAAKVSTKREMWKDRLRPLSSGAEFSKEESNFASARDFQFESFLGAVCELSGFDVQFCEPDLIISDGSENYGIAAKRPRNKKKFERHYKKGVKQIFDSGVSGLVAIDVTFSLQSDKCINTNNLSGAQIFVEEVANEFALTNYDIIQNLSKDARVIGALINVQMPVINFGHSVAPQLATATRWTIVPTIKDEDGGFRWASEFAKKCEIGLFGPRSSSQKES